MLQKLGYGVKYSGLQTAVDKYRDRGAVFLCVSAQQARCLSVLDDQSACAAVPAFVYDRLEFTVDTIFVLSTPYEKFQKKVKKKFKGFCVSEVE
ncbi:hypothetical protein Y032_0310g2096 [Ancylostoma ceylanicum]|uniref:Uncharacterized protein n=1 Tax=Ancylostoma ceylanicum TaxID=53326 RepID=A0A016S2A2_9BILA|nr:hypothetical protein Y032_0310g2096 [Ancylostoma ceylanicum]